MAGLFEGKVALISGAARGQGRSHAVRLAEEGADVIAFDLCEQIASVHYPMASPEDLDETVRLVEALGRRIVARTADVRDGDAVRAVVRDGLDQLGRIDIVAANAGIASFPGRPLWEIGEEQWDDMMDVNVKGVWQTISAAVPAMIERGEGGAIVITSSVAGVKGMAHLGDYSASKHAVVGVMRTLAVELAPHSIRVNTLHPTGVTTPMIVNAAADEFRVTWPQAERSQNLLPVDAVEPGDVTDALVFLASDAARYVTGCTLPVDAGILTD